MTQGLELRGAVLGKGYRLGRHLDDSEEHVHEATHERLPGHFVIRIFPPESLAQPESSSRIQRGARLASLLRDPHIVQVLDCSISGEVPAFVVMERLKGRSLGAAMSDDGMFTLARVVPLVESLAAALAAGHQMGLVHGDIRPGHILLQTGAGPAAKLGGFGWAKELRAAARLPVPSGYLAPEQQFGKVLTLDERVDQFGLAALTYELIAGCLPFSEESTDLADGATPRTPPAIADLVPGSPKPLDDILRRALSFRSGERFASVLDLAAELRRLLSSPAGRPTTSEAAVTVVAPFPMAPKTDITEELDLATLSSMGTAGEIRSGRDDQEIDVEDEYEDETTRAAGDAEQNDSDDSDDPDDARLVLGTRPRAPITDDAKTQIRRSPFLLDPGPDPRSADRDDQDDDHDGRLDDADEDESETGATLSLSPSGGLPLPKRGIPIGRPAPLRLGHPPGSGGSTLPAPDGGWGSGANAATDVSTGGVGSALARLWQQAKARKAWTFPVATGVILLVLVVAMIALSHDSDSEVAAGTPPKRPVATGVVQQPVAPPTAPPATVAAAPTVTPVVVPPAAPADAAVDPAVAPPPSGTAAPPPAAAVEPASGPDTPKVARPAAAGRRVVVKPATPGSSPVAATAPRTVPGVGPNDCTIRISSQPWAEVWIDGKNTGRKTPIDNLKVACGSHKLQLKRPDKDIEQMEMLQVIPGKPYVRSYELE